jgi:hypothetical protein
MADDQFQRPYRASEPPVRGPAKSPGNDPLAELARLIGQTDPFGEFGRRAPAPAPQDERSDWSTQPLGTRYTPQAAPDPRASVLPQRSAGNGYYAARSAPHEQPLDAAQNYYGVQDYGRQTYTDTSPAEDDAYAARAYAPGQDDYPQDVHDIQGVHDAHDGRDGQDIYDHDGADDEYYEDATPPRRRLGVVAIAGVLALAVIGTAGAFGYRTLFGSSGSAQQPPVIKADAGPNKIVPATSGRDSQSNKLITDRVNERGQSERLVSREEQPMDKPAAAAAVVLSQMPQQSPMGTGVVGNEPKKIRTIAIHPDQTAMADATVQGVSPLAAAAAPARAAAAPAAKPSPPPARAANTATADAEDDATPTARPAVRQAVPAGNAPLSLNPDGSPARAPAATARAAAIAPPAQAVPSPAASGGAAGPGSYVQVSSQRSEAEAQSAFRSLQSKYPDQLGGRPLQVLKVDLGAKGTYYRAMVGPFANASEAAELCASLKTAGGQCLIPRN